MLEVTNHLWLNNVVVVVVVVTQGNRPGWIRQLRMKFIVNKRAVVDD